MHLYTCTCNIPWVSGAPDKFFYAYPLLISTNNLNSFTGLFCTPLETQGKEAPEIETYTVGMQIPYVRAYCTVMVPSCCHRAKGPTATLAQKMVGKKELVNCVLGSPSLLKLDPPP